MGKIEINLILEILGRPKEHIVSALGELVNRLSTEKGVVIKQKKIHDPIEVKESKDIFTTFAEVNLEVDSVLNYFALIFGYMPANMEVVGPENIALSRDEFNMVTNRLLQRMHDYDSVVKKTLFDRERLVEKLREHAPQLFVKNPPKEEKIEDDKPRAVKKNKKKSKKSKD